MEKELIRTHKDLKYYQKAFFAAMEIFELSKNFPSEEKYALTDKKGNQLYHCGVKAQALYHFDLMMIQLFTSLSSRRGFKPPANS